MPDTPPEPPPDGTPRTPTPPGSLGTPENPIGVHRPRWIPVAIVVLSIAVVAAGILLVIDVTGWGSSTPQTTVQSQETRRAEVVAAVVEQSRRLDEAYATNNPDLLDDLYVSPDSPTAQNQKRSVAEIRDAGRRLERTTLTEVQSVRFTAPDSAEVRVKLTIPEGKNLDAETGEVLAEVDEPLIGERTIKLELIEEEWKIFSES